MFCPEHQTGHSRSLLKQLHKTLFESGLCGKRLIVTTDGRSLHKQHIHPLGRFTNKLLEERPFATMRPQVTRIEEPLAVCLNQNSVGVIS